MKSRNLIFSAVLSLLYSSVTLADMAKNEVTCSWREFVVDAAFKKSEPLGSGDIPILKADEDHVYFLLAQAKEGKFVMIDYRKESAEIHAQVSYGNMGTRSSVSGSMTPMKKTGGYFSFESGIKKSDGSYQNLEVSCIKPAN